MKHIGSGSRERQSKGNMEMSPRHVGMVLRKIKDSWHGRRIWRTKIKGFLHVNDMVEILSDFFA